MKTLVISLDTVGAKRLSALGSTTVATPNFDLLAAESALFSQAYASDIPTQPSHTALFTGRYGVSTGIVSHFHPPAMLDDKVTWMPSVYREQGCRTGAVDHLFSMKKWFIRGYDDYMVPPGRSRSPASVINELAFPWLDAHHDEDFFLFLHYWDAHIPYVPPEPFKTEYTARLDGHVDLDVIAKITSRPTYPLFKRNLYDHLDEIPSLDYVEALHCAEVAYLDAELGRLFNRLDDLGVLDECTIVIFGDHGENMTEHDAWFDHAGLYDSVVRVPLLIRAPGRVAPRRIDAMVSLVDVMPTLLGLDDLDIASGASGLDGRSLLPLIGGRATGHREYVTLSECTWQAKRGIRTREWKYIRCWDPGMYPRSGPELYNLANDPDEQINLAADHPDVAGALDETLTAWLRDRLGGGKDRMEEVVDFGLPAVARLEEVLREANVPG